MAPAPQRFPLSRLSSSALGPLLLLLVIVTGSLQGREWEALTFAAEPGRVYVPLEALRQELRWSSSDSGDSAPRSLNGTPLTAPAFRSVNGQWWVSLHTLTTCGASVEPPLESPPTDRYRVRDGRRGFSARVSPKRVEIDLSRQRLWAWQGSQLFLETKISSGRYGNTPTGSFTAGPYKAPMHYSSRYHNAPMPWSVQVTGHIFIHGFSSVPDYPASHGCIRMPLSGPNPARLFYQWVDVGTPIQITRGPREEIRRALPAS